MRLLGAGLLYVGLTAAIYFFWFFNTTVSAGDVLVHNVGLMQDRNLGVILGIGFAIVGALLITRAYKIPHEPGRVSIADFGSPKATPTWLKWILLPAMAGVTIWGYTVPPGAAFPNPELARMIFFHLPCALVTCWFVFFAPYLAVRYLMSKEISWDVRSAACNEQGFLFALLTMATGILFSKVQWGDWWSWDPRQTSFLFVLLIYGAYFALRAAISDESKRAANSAAYSIATVLPALFLIFVLPRIIFSLHPSDTLVNNRLGDDYRPVFLAALVLFTAISVWLYKLRVRVGLAELALENMNAKLDDGGDSAATGVVRPVPVPRES